MDFRDLIYRPALIALAPRLVPERRRLVILDQEDQGACTGFGLAAVVNFLEWERNPARPRRVSPRMLYEMARRHDQWPGQDYEGSSARGAMKGWFKSGVCSERAWPWDRDAPGFLTAERQRDALEVRLGAYYRVMPRRSDLHAALCEVGAVFASAAVHRGWEAPEDGVIPFDPAWPEEGGHAFAIVGYTDAGLLVQNSWGPDWGGLRVGRTRYRGVALWTYDDFDRHVWDLWVARLALPLRPDARPTTAKYTLSSSGTRLSTSGPPRHTIRDHYLHLDDGRYDPRGDYPSSAAEAEDVLRRALTGEANGGRPPAHLLLHAHGGLNAVKDAAKRIARWLPVFRDNDVHALHFIWETGLGEELQDLLLGKRRMADARVGSASSWWDPMLERVTRPVGFALWKDMQDDAAAAFVEGGAGAHALATLARLLAALPDRSRPRLHLVGHSAGGIWHARLLERWAQLAGPPIEQLILFAPACTHALFDAAIRPALARRRLGALHHFLLDDASEQADTVAAIYRKSLLYLVSNAYQSKSDVVPILGMEKFLPRLDTAGLSGRIRHYVSPRDEKWTNARGHGDFDEDEATMNAMLELVLGRAPRRRFTSSELAG